MVTAEPASSAMAPPWPVVLSAELSKNGAVGDGHRNLIPDSPTLADTVGATSRAKPGCRRMCTRSLTLGYSGWRGMKKYLPSR